MSSRGTTIARSLRPVAYHEAGHVVARWTLLRTCYGARIDPDGSGLTLGSNARVVGDRAFVENRLVITMAGPIAEARYRKCSSSAVWWTGGSGDWRDVDALLDVAAAEGWANDRQCDRQRYEDEARILVREHARPIAVVAEALLQRNTMSARRLTALLREVLA